MVCVDIDQMQGRAPRLIDQLIETRLAHQSTVAIQELMRAVRFLNPEDPRTAPAVQAITDQIQAMPEQRVFTPDADPTGRAALLAGVLPHLQGDARDAKLQALSDCVLCLQAQRLGLTVLTANAAAFDLLLQLVRAGRMLFYRTGV